MCFLGWGRSYAAVAELQAAAAILDPRFRVHIQSSPITRKAWSPDFLSDNEATPISKPDETQTEEPEPGVLWAPVLEAVDHGMKNNID